MTPSLSPRLFAGLLGALGAIAGLLALSTGVNAHYDATIFGRAQISCGTPFNPTAGLGGPPAVACEDAISSRRTWGWPLLALGGAALAGALLIQTPGRQAEEAGT